MKSAVCAIALLAMACTPASPAGGGRWLRRISLVAACAASFWDAQTTRMAVTRGAQEANGFLADANGRPRWGRMIGFKAGTCGGMAVAQELIFPRYEKPWTGLNIGLGAVYTGTALHNRSLAKQLRKP